MFPHVCCIVIVTCGCAVLGTRYMLYMFVAAIYLVRAYSNDMFFAYITMLMLVIRKVIKNIWQINIFHYVNCIPY